MIYTKEQQREIEERARARARKALETEVSAVRTKAEELSSFVEGKGGISKLSGADLERFRNMNSAIESASKDLADKKAGAITLATLEIEKEFEREPGDALPTGGSKSFELRPDTLGQLFVKSEIGRDWATGKKNRDEITIPDADVIKALMTTTANGYPPEVLRNGRVVNLASRAPRAIDLFPISYTDQNGVKFMEETVFSDNAAERLEGVASPEATLTLVERLSPVQKIIANLPVSVEQLADVPGIQSYIEQRLADMIRRRLSRACVSGTGVSPALLGLRNLPNALTNARGADSIVDSIFKMITRVYVEGDAEVDGILMHPTDVQTLRLAKVGAAANEYLFGHPGLALPMSVNGVPITGDVACTVGEAIVGDFGMYATVALRQGLDIQVTDSASSDFEAAVLRIRAMIRAALVFYRQTAFGKVTGLNA